MTFLLITLLLVIANSEAFFYGSETTTTLPTTTTTKTSTDNTEIELEDIVNLLTQILDTTNDSPDDKYQHHHYKYKPISYNQPHKTTTTTTTTTATNTINTTRPKTYTTVTSKIDFEDLVKLLIKVLKASDFPIQKFSHQSGYVSHQQPETTSYKPVS